MRLEKIAEYTCVILEKEKNANYVVPISLALQEVKTNANMNSIGEIYFNGEHLPQLISTLAVQNNLTEASRTQLKAELQQMQIGWQIATTSTTLLAANITLQKLKDATEAILTSINSSEDSNILMQYANVIIKQSETLNSDRIFYKEIKQAHSLIIKALKLRLVQLGCDSKASLDAPNIRNFCNYKREYRLFHNLLACLPFSFFQTSKTLNIVKQEDKQIRKAQLAAEFKDFDASKSAFLTRCSPR